VAQRGVEVRDAAAERPLERDRADADPQAGPQLLLPER
jgi:hypothetical protein